MTSRELLPDFSKFWSDENALRNVNPNQDNFCVNSDNSLLGVSEIKWSNPVTPSLTIHSFCQHGIRFSKRFSTICEIHFIGAEASKIELKRESVTILFL